MRPPKPRLLRLSAGRWLIAAAITLIVLAVLAGVLASLKQTNTGEGPRQARLQGSLPLRPLTVGRPATFHLTLDDKGGTALDPACVGGDLTPEFTVLQVTILDSPASSWSHDRSCGDILEGNSKVKVVITVMPLHPGTYTVRLLPQERARLGLDQAPPVRSPCAPEEALVASTRAKCTLGDPATMLPL